MKPQAIDYIDYELRARELRAEAIDQLARQAGATLRGRLATLVGKLRARRPAAAAQTCPQ